MDGESLSEAPGTYFATALAEYHFRMSIVHECHPHSMIHQIPPDISKSLYVSRQDVSALSLTYEMFDDDAEETVSTAVCKAIMACVTHVPFAHSSAALSHFFLLLNYVKWADENTAASKVCVSYFHTFFFVFLERNMYISFLYIFYYFPRVWHVFLISTFFLLSS